jgi:hypothetical protein
MTAMEALVEAQAKMNEFQAMMVMMQAHQVFVIYVYSLSLLA